MKKNIILACILLITASCSDFLGNQPKGEVIPETTKHYDMLLNSTSLVSGGTNYLNHLTDNVFISPTGQGYILGLNMLERSIQNLYTFNEEVFGQSETDNQWAGAYNRIFQYNIILENILNAAAGSETEKRKLWAEALLGRAYDFLTLINTYGKQYDASTAKTDLGVPLMTASTMPEGTLTRATVEEVYTQIIKDLEEAEKYLPEKPTTNTFRGSKQAVYGVLARMHLIRGEYDKALANANKVLTINNFLLDIKQYDITTDEDAASFEGRIVGIPEGKNNEESVYLKFDNYITGLSGIVFSSDDLLNLFDLDNDKRFLLYYSEVFDQIPLDRPLYMPFTYINVGISTPEMYLTAAECEARIGSKERALELINTLRNNRIIDNEPLTAESNDEALTIVLEERRRELAMIGMFRFIDLRRLNKDPRFAKTITHRVAKTELQEVTWVDEETGEEYTFMDYVEVGEPIIYTLEPNSPKYVMPIPPKILRFNPGMPDNDRK